MQIEANIERPSKIVPLDPLDRTIVVSDDERRQGTLSPQNRKLGAMVLHARGYVVLERALPLEFVDELREAFAPLYADCTTTVVRGHSKVNESERTKTSFWERKARFRIFPRLKPPFSDVRVLANPFAMGIVKETLGDRVYCKSVSSDTCLKGSILQAPHRDLDFYDGATPFGCIINIPIMHCGLHNGPLEVWPGGSHLWYSEKFLRFGVRPFVQDGENPLVEAFAAHIPSKKIELRPGDLLIRDPGMWHRGNPNPIDEPRTMLTTSYFRREFFYDYGDPEHNLDEELFNAFDPAVRELFSYCFDRTDRLYWKMHKSRAYRKLEARRLLGAPLRVGERLITRLRATTTRYE
jgi:ectoine hydroxylase-related dioxygenase (phytanoyl-CoA dioxygenase family)